MEYVACGGAFERPRIYRTNVHVHVCLYIHVHVHHVHVHVHHVHVHVPITQQCQEIAHAFFQVCAHEGLGMRLGHMNTMSIAV